jgi:hypothetical protein
MSLHPIDGLVIAAYAVITLAIGLRFARRNKTTDRYFLGGRDFPGWAIGLSFIGSTISSITFIAYPADSFKTAWLRILPPLAFPVVVLFAAYTFIPFFRRGTVHSAYHYLALRFGPSVSLYAAVVYLVMQVVRASTVTYLLAVLLSTLTQWPVLACIALSAGVTAVYTIKGGFEAVVWTDVIQTIVLLLGAAACVIFIVQALLAVGEDRADAGAGRDRQLPRGTVGSRLGAAVVLGPFGPGGAQGDVCAGLWRYSDLGRIHVPRDLPVDLLSTISERGCDGDSGRHPQGGGHFAALHRDGAAAWLGGASDFGGLGGGDGQPQ